MLRLFVTVLIAAVSCRRNLIDQQLTGDWYLVVSFVGEDRESEMSQRCLAITLVPGMELFKCEDHSVYGITVHFQDHPDAALNVTGVLVTTIEETRKSLNCSSDLYVFQFLKTDYYLIHREGYSNDEEATPVKYKLMIAREIPSHAELIDFLHTVKDLHEEDGYVVCTREVLTITGEDTLFLSINARNAKPERRETTKLPDNHLLQII